MYYLLYTSEARFTATGNRLTELLEQCNRNNTRLHITGLLLYLEGKFMQFIEGEEAIISQLYQNITQDPRHEQVTLLEQGSQTGRQFPNWAMGCYAALGNERLPLPAHINLNQNELIFESEAFNPHPALKHLKGFYRQIKQAKDS